MEVWKWELVTTSKQISNSVTFIKTIILDHSSTANVIIYDSDDGTNGEFMTIHNTAEELTKPIILENPAQLENGCYVVPSAGKVWIQYKAI